MKTKKYNILINLTIITFSLLFIFTAIEFTLRILGLGQPLIYNQSNLVGYYPRETQKITQFRNSTITIDEFGFRNSKSFNNNDVKIIFFGDSVTFGGSYIDDQETFTEKTCHNINRGTAKKNISCANAGVNAYGVRNMIARIRYEQSVHRDFTLVITVLEGDFDRNFAQIKSLPFFVGSPYKLIPASSELISLVLDKARFAFRNGSGSMANTQSDRTLNIQAQMEREASLNELRNLLLARKNLGLQSIVVWSPSKTEIINDLKPEVKLSLEEYLTQAEIPFIDINKYLDKNKDNLDSLFFDEVHLDKLGHKKYAQIISDYLIKEFSRS